MKRIIFSAAISLLLIFHPGLMDAKKIPPDQVKITTPVYTPELPDFNPKLGRYTYSVSWQGISAGTVDMNLNKTDDDYEIAATARSAQAIDYVYKLRYRTKAVISAKTLTPRRSVATTHENSRRKKIELEFFPDGQIQSVYTDHKGRRKSVKFDPGNFTLDPFSTALLALSMDWKVGDKRQFDTYHGRNRYLIELTAVDFTDIIINGSPRKAIVISPTITKLTEAETKKLRKALIYIAADKSREILKISSELFFGAVEVEMGAFTPAKPNPAVEKPEKIPLTQAGEPVAVRHAPGSLEIY